MNGLAVCAGIGGIELGLKLVLGDSYRTVAFVEREAYPAACLVKRMEEGFMDHAPIWDDVRTFDGAAWRGVVDIVTAGYPCQPFSCAGKKQGAEDNRHLWPYIQRIVEDVRPALCFFENVSNHLNIGFREVCEDLWRMGYGVEAGIFAAAEVGAPHLRRRLFILAYTEGIQFRQVACSRTDNSRHISKGLAYPEHGEWRARIDHGQRTTGAGVGDGGEKLADSKCCRVRNESERGEGAARQAEPGHAEPFDDSAALADSAERGRGMLRRTSGREGQLDGGDTGLADSQWPPGPDGDWSRIPEDSQPAIRRMADGIPDRVDRLRALGNAVVPAVAAKAFRALTERAGTCLK